MIQGTLRSTLHQKLSGTEVDEVRVNRCRAMIDIFLIHKNNLSTTCDCSDHPKGSRVLDLYRQAGPTYSSRCTGLLQRSYSCYFLVLRDVGGTLSDILSIHQGEGPCEQKVI